MMLNDENFQGSPANTKDFYKFSFCLKFFLTAFVIELPLSRFLLQYIKCYQNFEIKNVIHEKRNYRKFINFVESTNISYNEH